MNSSALISPAQHSYDKAQVTGLVLAGGGSSRMHSTIDDKGLLLWQNKPLASYALERLGPQVGTIAINANRHLPDYALLDVPVWIDERDADWERFPGPLAGMLTGLRHSQTPWLATVPCDAPLFPHNLVEKLLHTALNANVKIVYACTMQANQPGQTAQRVKDHPVFALLHHSLKDSLYAYLQGGDRKILLWIKQHAHERVLFDEHTAFMANINTPANLADLCELTHTVYPL